MQLQKEVMLNLVDAFYRPVGQIMVEEYENDLISGEFVPGPAFGSMENLFLSFEEAVGAQAFSMVDELDAQIAALGLRLYWSSEIPPTEVKDVQIWSDGGVSFQLCHDLLASSNGYQQTMAAIPRVESLTGQVAGGVLV